MKQTKTKPAAPLFDERDEPTAPAAKPGPEPEKTETKSYRSSAPVMSRRSLFRELREGETA